MTPSELKSRVENRGIESHYFTRQTMKYFGDTMKNYGVRSKPVNVETYTGEVIACWELYRKRPVKHGLQSSVYFCCETFRRVFPVKGD